MKRMMQFSFAILFLSMAFFAVAAAQEKKTESRIKVIIADKSGEKIVIDTVFAGEPSTGSFITKDGKVIIIGDSPDKNMTWTHSQADKHSVITIVTDDEKGDKGEKGEKVREIRIVKGDSIKMISEGEKVILVEGKPLNINDKDSEITWISSDKETAGKRVMVYSAGSPEMKGGEKRMEVKVVSGENEIDGEKVNMVIAKDGMVINIEGNDEAKAKELAELIEKHLGMKEGVDKTVVKEEVKRKNK